MLTVIIINTFTVALAVIIHYEFLFQMTVFMPRLKIRHRFRIVLGIFGALTAHAIEVWVFALAYYLLCHLGLGALDGNVANGFLDSVYFSFTSFTTLGLGDIEPTGLLRYLTGIESLTGLVLITWTASFLYIEMQRYWTK